MGFQSFNRGGWDLCGSTAGYAAMCIGDASGLNETIAATVALFVFVGVIVMLGRCYFVDVARMGLGRRAPVLTRSYVALEWNSAPGIDGVTWL